MVDCINCIHYKTRVLRSLKAYEELVESLDERVALQNRVIRAIKIAVTLNEGISVYYCKKLKRRVHLNMSNLEANNFPETECQLYEE